MIRKTILFLGVLAISGISSAALAEWTGKGELGGSFASGNSDHDALNAALELTGEYGKWAHKLGFAGYYGKDDSETSAQRWEARAETQYLFSGRTYGFGASRYEDDRFSAYNYQASLSGGLGRKIIDSERSKFWVQGGPGYRIAEFRDTGDNDDGMILRGDLGLDYQLTGTAKVVERFLVESGADNTYVQNDLGLEVSINGALALRLGYQLRHNTDVLPGTKKTDRLTTVGLVYEVK